METNQHGYNNPQPEQKQGFLHSATAKIIMVGLLTLILLIPLQYVKSLIWERAERQEDVVTEISDQWGGSVYLYGPILKVPYTDYEITEVTDEKTKRVTTTRTASTYYAYFYPEQLKVISNIDTQPLHRNNYEATVFNAKVAANGKYIAPDFSSRKIDAEAIEWDKASLVLKCNNLKNIDGAANITFNGKEYSLEPVAGNENDSLSELETEAIDLSALKTGEMPFSIGINYKGSKQLKIAPIGKQTVAEMKSNWHTPSFTGGFIPNSKTITDNGFSASWSVSHLNRPFAQQHFGRLPDIDSYAFGVNFLIPVDQYQQNERAAKYGFLVIGLTFLIFFLIQVMSKINIHIFQYTMIGLALIMFYTLLISITEHSSFALAYIVAGASVVAMITLYSVSILRNIKFPLFIGTSLTALYSFIYIIIQLENYALLAGSIGLFLILGAVMFVSRKIDWNQSRLG
ncbi:cell envelope integrity protein CreD [Flavobacterium sp. D11R37]|uniref:cell envelope integrity protein CreD n=1 Tax=Flavobacterium coralii TaxID=2838017 RepID=UPI001CA660E6|nr:cell envelope integrity protein CreD [Flavobacterium coralii]MBY8961844.1 cell envelope integrity protein CreD [Flavobacterium coralii]